MIANKKLRPDTLSVCLNDRSVGTLTRLTDETIIFAFDPDYANDSERPVLSLSFKAPDGGLMLGKSRTGTRLSPFFSNLLPEGRLRDYLARKLEINSQREFYLLAGLGLDLPGAVIVEPLGELSQGMDAQHLEHADQQSPLLRFSLAGVQLKFSAIAEAQGGFTVPANGAGGSWIVKLPSERHLQVPETEYSMLTLARQVGITVPEFKLVPTTSIEGLPEGFRSSVADSLAVKRFDRTATGGRIHMEDFAQVYGVYPKDKYEKAGYSHIARVLWMESGEESFTEFIRRLVFTVVIGNGDMHLKNWTLLYLDPRKPILSPAYDFVPSIAYIGEKETLGLNLGGTKDFRDVTLEEFKKMAAQAKASERLAAVTVHETLDRIKEAWSRSRFDLRLPDDVRRIIDEHMAHLPLLKLPPVIPSIDLKLRNKHADRLKQLVITDLEYDPIVPDNTIILEAYTGYSTAVNAPDKMEPVLIEAAAQQGLLPELAEGPVRVFVGDKLYRQWRRIRFITLDFAELTTTTESAEWRGDRGLLTGRFLPEVWQKIVSAHQRKSLEEFDLILPEGAIHTFKAKVQEIDDIKRLDDGEMTEASIVLSLYDSKIILRPQEGIAYLLSPFELNEVQEGLAEAFRKNGWEASLFSETHKAIARRTIKAVCQSQMIDVPLEAKIIFQADAHKTDLLIKITDKDGRFSSLVNGEARQLRQQILDHLPVEG